MWIVGGILRFQKLFEINVLDFYSALVKIFWPGNCFGYFSIKIGQNVFECSGHTVSNGMPC
jgi:hypothetical protein